MTASRQAGPDALVEEVVRGVPLRCYAQRPHSVVEVLEQALTTSADDVLLVDPTTGTTTTYDSFARLVEGAAATLLARGLEPGNRVAVLARNGLEAAVAIWACARAGLVHVGIPVDAPPARVAALLELTGASLLLVQPSLAGAVPPGMAAADAAGLLLCREIAWRHGQPLPDQDTTYSLIPTSGTTGHPKAVQVTGRMLGHAAAFYTRTLGLTRQDRTAIHLPFAWVSGHVTQLTPAMLSGGSAVTMATFSAGQLVAVAAEHGVTWLDVVPSIWELLLRAEGFALPALSGVRLAVFGGAPAPPGTLDRVRERLPQLRLFDVYALSETCAPVTCLSDTEALRRPGSVGRPAPYCEVRLVGPDERDVPRGEPGEIWVRSPAVTPGYWGGAPTPVTADGWLRTGDLGRMDTEGYLQVGGRAVDLIIRGGVNIYPAEVERALLATGLLADAVAVGIPSAVTGHNVGAAVVAVPGTDPDRHVLQAAVRAALGAHAVPRPLRVVDELPRNRNGKVDREAVLTALLAPDG
ncbi:MAG: acyl--CoA ligase [Actinobacteria bacterium]|nr:acyl--CoA ligase [Actinomycetota bacterium]MBW3646175.1 acyl--CoA ligase [Actinomycetota bacterium]